MLLTKLHIPSPGKNLVQRDNLSSKLNQGLKSKLTLISAPAGFGKTTLLSEWINKEEIPTAWFSLSKGDNDPVDFLGYIILAIQGIKKEFGQSALELLKTPNTPNTESIINTLINEMIQIRKDFLLVFDDFHLINNSEVVQLLAYLIENIPDNTHIVILTRSDPALPIARLRSQHHLVELRSSDLSFSVNEISTLFNKKLKIKLSIEDCHKLENRTEGWLAGLHLTALSIPDPENVTDFIDALKGDNRFIMDYLIEEVLKIQPDYIKEFLLQTSILEQISAPLCNTVLNRTDSQEVLEELEKSGMFVIPLDTERHWYRYHHLFADLLKQRLLLNDKTLIEDLHKKASRWFVDNEMYDLALEHTLVIKDYAKSIQLLEEVIENMWKNGLHSAILSYGSLIPDEVIKNHPEFCLYYSWILVNIGQNKNAEPLLEFAQKITGEKISDVKLTKHELQNYIKLSGKISVALAHLYLNQQQPEKILAYCQTAMENLSDDDPLWLGWAWNSKGTAELNNGNVKQGIEDLYIAVEYGKKSDNIYLISSAATSLAHHESIFGQYKTAYKRCSDLLDFMNQKGYSQIAKAEWIFAGLFTMMSVTECLWADFDKALESVKTAYELCKNEKNITQRIIALLAYSYILHAHENKVGALNKLSELEVVLKQYNISPYIISTYVGWKIYLLIESEQLDAATDFIKECGMGINEKISYKNEHAYINFARLLITQHQFDEATSMLSELYSLAYDGNRIESLVQIKILYAIMNKMIGSREEAVTNLIEAMEFAADENLLNYFLFDLAYTTDLLKEVYKIQASTNTKIPYKFINKLKLAIEKKEKTRKNNAESDLSTREFDILVLIAKDYSNQEVADQLFISIHTVKSHVKNILLKLEVESRSKAVTEARELGII